MTFGEGILPSEPTKKVIFFEFSYYYPDKNYFSSEFVSNRGCVQ